MKKSANSNQEVAGDEFSQHLVKQVGYCQLFMRFATGVIMAAFVGIIVLTTVSTGDFVQVVAKILYFVIVGSGLASFAVWIYRTRLEKRMQLIAYP